MPLALMQRLICESEKRLEVIKSAISKIPCLHVGTNTEADVYIRVLISRMGWVQLEVRERVEYGCMQPHSHL